MSPAVVLVGPPGAGKTTVGQLLATRWGVDFADTDDLVEARTGRVIADIFTSDGEPAFRELEREAVAQALASHAGVLALGGGAVLAEETRTALSGHPVVLLSVGLAAGVRRTGLSTARPLLAGVNPRATFAALLAERLPVYRAVAVHEIGTDERTAEEVADAVHAALTAAEAAAEDATTAGDTTSAGDTSAPAGHRG
ncbi:shikimate kinase [Actinomycetospora endophytica]|uniref:Shikimate kinase n=1 Tax=Actinomycetospora endophytica TaxID=2291215 RepID=A0ABS8PI06_9PSEU|nr:shikimate kinase [Actinomycetospora endophytica]MCD2197809.1 shikimate kinase [Actinomycetospora endophytica]